MRKYPFVMQHDAMQCGIACLAMICDYYGKEYSLRTLSHICNVSKEGVSLLGISDAAHKLGFDTVAGYATVEQLCKVKFPCILHWNQNHFVVLYEVSNNKRFCIADPSKGIVTCDIDEIAKHWISTQERDENVGVVMLFQPNSKFGKIKENISEEKGRFNLLLEYVKPYKKYFVLIFTGLLLGSVLQLMMPFLTQAIVDVGIKNKSVNFIWLVLLGELAIVLGRTLTDFIRRRLLLHISMRIEISLVSDFFIKLFSLSMPFFETKLMGDLLQRISDHNRVQSFLTNQSLNATFAVMNFIIFGSVLLYYNNLIFILFMIGSLSYGMWIALFFNKRKIIDYELFEKQSINKNKTYQLISSMQEIKLQDCEKRHRMIWEDVQADLFMIQMKSLKLQQTQEAGSIFINEVKNIVITVLAATSVINGQITLGMMLAVQYIIGQLNSPVEQLMKIIYSFQDMKISLNRISEIHEMEEEDAGSDRYTDFGSSKKIVFDSVDFKYNAHALNNTLDNVSFSIPEGKITAIVGTSGSGKTTLIKLMLGYYSISNGTIFIAGRNINDYNLKWWRKQCGIVMQEGVVFSESIARNIAVSDGDIDEDRLEFAARIANIHDYIIELPLKYNTIIGQDGIGISQGQKQRILIARAVYKNPEFIFLDEATNALDAENEKIIVNNLTGFYKGKTVVIVAHRLSTVKNADQIIVLDHGRVAEIGDHASLVKKRGIYYNLVRNQLELGI